MCVQNWVLRKLGMKIQCEVSNPFFFTWKSCPYDYISPGWMPVQDKICVRGHLEKTLHRICIFRKTNDVFPLCTRLENGFVKNETEITPNTSRKLFEIIGTLGKISLIKNISLSHNVRCLCLKCQEICRIFIPYTCRFQQWRVPPLVPGNVGRRTSSSCLSPRSHQPCPWSQGPPRAPSEGRSWTHVRYVSTS